MRPEIRAFFDCIVAHGNYDASALTLVLRYCELLNQLEDIKQERVAKGITFTFNDKHGQPRAHPLVKYEISLNNELGKTFRLLGWDLSPPGQMDLFGGKR